MRLGDRPVIEHLCDALIQCEALDGFALATSIESSDDAVAAFAEERGIPCLRGSLTNVAERILAAAHSLHGDVLVRVSGDSPLLDPKLVDQGVELFLREQTDIVTNVRPRSFPKGESVEVIRTAILADAVAAMATVEEREHVTPYFYSHPDRFLIRSFAAVHPRPEVNLSIDTAEDFGRCREILKRLGQPAWQVGWEACVAEYDVVMGPGWRSADG